MRKPLLKPGDRRRSAFQLVKHPAHTRSGGSRRGRPSINLVLLLATFLSATWIGARLHQGFLSSLQSTEAPFVWWHGLGYSLTILAILGVHELGHYCACRRYRINASLPYFLPEPVLIGTLGAFIRIRRPIPTERALFDIAVAGPIAGFVVAGPALFVGVGLSQLSPRPNSPEEFAIYLGEPLLLRFASWTIWGATPACELGLHPMALAAWLGLLAAAVNLFPVGQLDGGHISYAVFGARSTFVTVVAVFVLLALALRSPIWIVWAAVVVVALVAFGPRHPRTLDHDVPIDATRVLVATCALVIFVICFTPAPLRIVEGQGEGRSEAGPVHCSPLHRAGPGRAVASRSKNRDLRTR